MVKTALRILVLALGLGLFGWFIHRAGPGEIMAQVAELGWWAPVILVPFFLVYLADTLGWFFAFGDYAAKKPSYATLFRVRWSGESVNNVVPSAYIGGEALKVYLLHKRGIPGVTAGTSVVASKTCQVLAQVIFIGLGAAVGLPHLEPGTPARFGMWVIACGAGAVVVLLFALQRHGMFDGLRRLLAAFSLKPAALEKHRDSLSQLDQQIFRFYHRNPGRFFASTTAYLGGWLLDTLEVYLVCYLLGHPLAWTEAVAIEAFISVAKAMGIFVPAALGVQESGVVLLFQIFGLPAPLGVAYAIIRRGRDVFYVLVGGLMLYAEEMSWKDLTRRVREEELV